MNIEEYKKIAKLVSDLRCDNTRKKRNDRAKSGANVIIQQLGSLFRISRWFGISTENCTRQKQPGVKQTKSSTL